jgi:hypothetical protein
LSLDLPCCCWPCLASGGCNEGFESITCPVTAPSSAAIADATLGHAGRCGAPFWCSRTREARRPPTLSSVPTQFGFSQIKGRRAWLFLLRHAPIVAEPTGQIGQVRRVSRLFIAYQLKLAGTTTHARARIPDRSAREAHGTVVVAFPFPKNGRPQKSTAAPHSTHRQDRPRARTDSAGSVMSTAPFPIRFRMLVSVIGLLSSTGGQCSRLGYALSPFCYSYRLVRRGGNGWSRSSNSPRGPAGWRPCTIEGIDKGLRLDTPSQRVLPRVHLNSQGNQRIVSIGLAN